jgi:CRP/FNR family cyclic AMP-dependent transcriptional regulator
VEEALAKVAVFERLSPEHRAELGRYFSRARYRTGERIFEEGDEADAFYVILSGQVQIIKGGSSEDSRIVAILSPGDFFGEMGLVEKAPRLAAAYMLDRGDLAVMAKANFDAMMEEHPLIAMKIRTEIMRRHSKNIKGTLDER